MFHSVNSSLSVFAIKDTLDKIGIGSKRIGREQIMCNSEILKRYRRVYPVRNSCFHSLRDEFLSVHERYGPEPEQGTRVVYWF